LSGMLKEKNIMERIWFY